MPADAKASAPDDLPAPPAAAPAKSGNTTLIIALVLTVILSTAASGGIAWWLSSRNAAPAEAVEGEEPVEEKKEPANYVGLTPAFVVNLEDDEAMRFLQIEVELMTRDPKMVEEIKLHTPRIRNALLMLFGQQRAADLGTRAGKEKLQADVLASVQAILTEESGAPGVEAVYFTSFVMQ